MDLERCASFVVPGLYVSGMPAHDWPLRDWGVDLVVSLSEHLPPQAARRWEWGTPGEAVGDGKPLFTYWPIVDGDLPDDLLLRHVVDTVSRATRDGLRVLLHCYEGRNRCGLVAALVVRQLRGVSGEEALNHVRRARPGMVSNRQLSHYLNSLPAPDILGR